MESAVRRMIERRVEGVAIMTFGMEDVLACFQGLLRFWRASVPFEGGEARHEFYGILRSLNEQAGSLRRSSSRHEP
jgi:hypothetical protein